MENLKGKTQSPYKITYESVFDYMFRINNLLETFKFLLHVYSSYPINNDLCRYWENEYFVWHFSPTEEILQKIIEKTIIGEWGGLTCSQQYYIK